MSSPHWSASQYVKFEDERTRPARDLLAQVPLENPRFVVDLGCGPGNSTELLARRWPGAEVLGIDSAPDMLVAARLRLPSCRFDEADIADWQPDATPDLLYANAALQWLPDQLNLIRRYLDLLAPGGVLAVQMPDNEPTHRAMSAVAGSPEFAAAFAGSALQRTPLPQPRDYIEALDAGTARIDVWHTIYNHALDGAEAIVEWVKGTGLRPYLQHLPEDRRPAFLAAYLDEIRRAYPPLANGKVLLRFPRFFLVAVRK